MSGVSYRPMSTGIIKEGTAMNRLTTTTATTSLLLATAVANAVDSIEPFQEISSYRSNEVDIADPLLGTSPHFAAYEESGMWYDAGFGSDASSQGEVWQWTRVDADYIGGFVSARTEEHGGTYSLTRGDVVATFEVGRTGSLQADAVFHGLFSMDEGEIVGSALLERIDTTGATLETVFDWSHAGVAGEQAEMEYAASGMLRPGRYRFTFDAVADVHGIEMGPDGGQMTTFASIMLAALPDCGDPAAGDCLAARETPSCDDSTCCDLVCDADPFCCNDAWDEICVGQAFAGCTGCTGDLDGNGVVDGGDQGLLFAAWGDCTDAACDADLNGDGRVDGKDFGILMANWGGC